MVLLRVDEVGGGTVGCSGEPNGWGERKGKKMAFTRVSADLVVSRGFYFF